MGITEDHFIKISQLEKQLAKEQQAKKELVDKLEFIMNGAKNNWEIHWPTVKQLINKHKDKIYVNI
jgi:hypothetical protein